MKKDLEKEILEENSETTENSVKEPVNNSFDVMKEADKLSEDCKKVDFKEKFSSIEEQAKGYSEAEKALTQKSQELSDAKKQLENVKNLLKNLGYTDENHAQSVNKRNHLKKLKEAELKQADSVAVNDLKTLVQMSKSGKISVREAQSLKKVIESRLNECKTAISAKYDTQGEKLADEINNRVFTAFQEKKGDYFNEPAKIKVLNYLKETSGIVSPQELESVSGMIELIENAAVERYKSEGEEFRNLMNSNQEAKSRLNSAADSLASTVAEGKKKFSREQIKRMSNKEFEKYEKDILSQMMSGDLR